MRSDLNKILVFVVVLAHTVVAHATAIEISTPNDMAVPVPGITMMILFGIGIVSLAVIRRR